MPQLPVGVIAIILTVAIANLGNNIVAPVIPDIRQYFSSTAAEVSLVASCFGVGRLLMDLPAGYLSDRISPNKLFACGIVIAASAAGLASISSTIAQLIIFRTVMGFGAAIMSTVALTLLVDLAPPSRRGEVLSYYTSALLFGQAIAPSIGGYLASLVDWRAAFVFCTLTPLVTMPLNLLASAKAQEARGWSRGTGVPKARLVASEGEEKTDWPALGAVYFTTITNFFNRQGMRQLLLPLFGAMVLSMDTTTIGLILTVGSIGTIFINLPAGQIADRLGRKRLLIPGMLVLVAGDLVLVATGDVIMFVVATVLISMAVLANSMQSGLVADLIPARLIGNGMGTYRFCSDIGTVFGPFLMGIALDRYGFAASSALGGTLVLLSVAVALVLVPRRTLSVAKAGSSVRTQS